MARSFISDFSDGDTVDEVFLVREKHVRSNRAGSLYLQVELDDRSGSMSGRFWNATESDARGFDVGDYLAIKGKVQLFQGQLQLIINAFSRCDPANVRPGDFVPTTERDIPEMVAFLRSQLEGVKDRHYGALGKAFLMDPDLMDRFCRAPAGVRNHHAYLGGLLEHVHTLLTIHGRIRDLYPDLDHDLLTLGIFLHDIGKTRELRYDRGFSYTDEGQLIGHLVLGVEILNDKVSLASELIGEAIPEEKVQALKHLIISHHGTHEFGSPKLPMSPEAIALHHLDNLDAKVHNFSRTIRDDPSPGTLWTPYDASLGRRLFKGSHRAKPAAQVKTDRNNGLKGGLG